MAANGIPFFLFETGETPFVPAGGGFRSFVAIWMGGAGTPPFTPPPPTTNQYDNPLLASSGKLMSRI